MIARPPPPRTDHGQSHRARNRAGVRRVKIAATNVVRLAFEDAGPGAGGTASRVRTVQPGSAEADPLPAEGYGTGSPGRARAHGGSIWTRRVSGAVRRRARGGGADAAARAFPVVATPCSSSRRAGCRLTTVPGDRPRASPPALEPLDATTSTGAPAAQRRRCRCVVTRTV
jgi:hypothetical protein